MWICSRIRGLLPDISCRRSADASIGGLALVIIHVLVITCFIGSASAQISRESSGPGATAAEPTQDFDQFGGCTGILPPGHKHLPKIHASCRRSLARSGDVSAFSADTEDRDQRWIILWNRHGRTDAVCEEAEHLTVGRFNGTCLARYSRVLNGFSAQFTPSQLGNFLRVYGDYVDSVHEDQGVTAAVLDGSPVSWAPKYVDSPVPWALDRLDQASLPLDNKFGYSEIGTGVNVYVVDTGVRASHHEFRYPDGRPGSRAAEVFASITSGEPDADCNGHGTHVAASIGGLTYGVAKNVTLHSVRALECLGNGSVSEVIQGLDWVRINYKAPAVVVMALGGDSQYALDLAVRDLVSAGLPVLVAAGNEDADACTKSPAREPLAISVAATTQNDTRLWIEEGVASNYGPCVDLWAPGADIVSAARTSDTAVEFRSGTSQAVPFVAGVLAMYLQSWPDASPPELMTALAAGGDWGRVTETPGEGTADAVAGTPNLLLRARPFRPLIVEPQYLTIRGVGLGFGPYTLRVALAEVPEAEVEATVTLSDGSRGTLTPRSLLFTPADWNVSQLVTLDTNTPGFGSIDSRTFFVQLTLQSSDARFDGMRPRIQVVDRKGDTLAYPKVIKQLPFTDADNTYFYEDDYQGTCEEQYTDTGGGQDVVYYLAPPVTGQITISLCPGRSSPEAFDTKLYVVENLAKPETFVSVAQCNDDYCAYQSQITMTVEAGKAYGIVVDGFSGLFGPYQLSVTAAQGPMNCSLPPPGYGQGWPAIPATLLSVNAIPTLLLPAITDSQTPGVDDGEPAPADQTLMFQEKDYPSPPPPPPSRPSLARLRQPPPFNFSYRPAHIPSEAPPALTAPAAAPARRPRGSPPPRLAPTQIRPSLLGNPAVPAIGQIVVSADAGPGHESALGAAPPGGQSGGPSVGLPGGGHEVESLHTKSSGDGGDRVPLITGDRRGLLEILHEPASSSEARSGTSAGPAGSWSGAVPPAAGGGGTDDDGRYEDLPRQLERMAGGECSSRCKGRGVQEISVMCVTQYGRVLPAAACGPAPLEGTAEAHVAECGDQDCGTGPSWAAGPWGPCDKPCGGGMRMREVVCRAGDGTRVPDSRCPLPKLASSANCNTGTCLPLAWQAGPWGPCSIPCGGEGVRSRNVTCHSLLDGSLVDDSLCPLESRPSDTEACGGTPCNTCWNRDLGSSVCLQRGLCVDGSCICNAGYDGDVCQYKEGCHGVTSTWGACCEGLWVDRQGDCCPLGYSRDRHGECCGGPLDACGDCGGQGRAIDLSGACCEGVLDAGGLCCPSGTLDACGVCDGDGSTCALSVSLWLDPDEAVPVHEIALVLGVSWDRMTLERPSQLPRNRSVFQAPTAGSGSLASRYPARYPADRRRHLASVEGDTQEQGVIPEKNADAAAEAPGQNPGPAAEPRGQNPDPAAKLPRQNLPWKDEAEGNMEKGRNGGRPWWNSSDGLPEKGAEAGAFATVYMLPGTKTTRGRTSEVLSPGQALSMLEEALEGNNSIGWSGSAAGGWTMLDAVAGIKEVAAVAVCGNGVCETGELPLVLPPAHGGADTAGQNSYCSQDCPVAWHQCGAPEGLGIPSRECGGNGLCIHSSGTCNCFEGYAGDLCGSCAQGYRQVGTACVPDKEWVWVYPRAVTRETTSSGPAMGSNPASVATQSMSPRSQDGAAP